MLPSTHTMFPSQQPWAPEQVYSPQPDLPTEHYNYYDQGALVYGYEPYQSTQVSRYYPYSYHPHSSTPVVEISNHFPFDYRQSAGEPSGPVSLSIPHQSNLSFDDGNRQPVQMDSHYYYRTGHHATHLQQRPTIGNASDMGTSSNESPPATRAKGEPRKCKRHSPEVIAILRSHFAKNSYPNNAEFETLVQQTGLTVLQMRNWFRTQRSIEVANNTRAKPTRTCFTAHYDILKEYYNREQYLDDDDISIICQQSGLTERQVKRWLTTQRYEDAKKMKKASTTGMTPNVGDLHSNQSHCSLDTLEEGFQETER